uniref:Uncharacterized protein n=1 Tax=Thermorudis peleae TaxID=1382356 RepID=A0A831THW3_9BACT
MLQALGTQLTTPVTGERRPPGRPAVGLRQAKLKAAPCSGLWPPLYTVRAGNIHRQAGPSFDFGELFRRLAELERLAQALQVAELAAHTQEAKDRINGCKMRLSRYLNPVYFTREGPYHHDLRTAILGPPVRYPTPGEPPFEPDYFPGLQPAKRLPVLDPASGNYWVLYSTLLRERNRVLHALDQAIRDLSETLAGV